MKRETMIIQCQGCLARFKLDPSRIKGKGARIRCRKCGEAIIVMKSDFPLPEATPPVRKDLFDLRAVLRESEATVPVPTREKVDSPIGRIPDTEQEAEQVAILRGEGPAIPAEREPESLAKVVAEPAAEHADTARVELEAPIESPPLREEEAEQGPSLPEEEPPAPSHDEIEAPIESPLLREEEAERGPLSEEEPAPPTEREPEAPWQEVAEPAATPRDEVDTSFDSPLFREEEAEQGPSLPEEEPPPPSVEKEALDLRSVFYQPEEKTAAPSHDEIEAPIESPLLREEEAEQAPTLPEEEPAPLSVEKEALDLRSVFYQPEEKTAAPSHGKIDPPLETPPRSEEEKDHPPPRSEEEPPPSSVEEDALYLRSVLYVPDEKTVAPSQDDVTASFESQPLSEEEAEQAPPLPTEDPMPPAEGEREVLGAEPAEPSARPTLPPGNEVDPSTKIFISRGGMPDQTPHRATEIPTRTPDFPDDPISLDLGTEKELPFLRIPAYKAQEAAGEEHLTLPPPSEEKSAPGEEQEEFLRLDTALPDFLRKMGPTAEPAKRFDISGRLRASPTEISQEDTGPVPPVPDRPPEIEELPLSRADTLQEELAEIAEVAPVEDSHVAEPPPPDIPPPLPMEIERKQVTHQRSRARSGKPSIALLSLLFTVLAGGGAYLAFTETGKETLRTIVPNLESFWLGGKEAVPPYHVGNLIGYYENGNAGKMFIIKGVVTNQGRTAKSGIRIHAELLDVNQQTIAEKTAYAGNIITGLRSAARERIETAMSNHLGDKLSNVDIGPGKSVPFMVVFFDSPEGIEEYRLEALDAE